MYKANRGDSTHHKIRVGQLLLVTCHRVSEDPWSHYESR